MDDATAPFSTLARFLGEPVSSPTWVAVPHEDAWLVAPADNRRGGALYLVQADVVQPIQLEDTDLDAPYRRLQERLRGRPQLPHAVGK